MNDLPLHLQVSYLFVLALPVACIAWTVTHEEVFREPREFCQQKSAECRSLLQRKFFYLFTCEYCFSHYVTLFILLLTDFQLVLPGWRGYLIAFFSLVWIANIYMSIFGRIRIVLKNDRLEAKLKENEVKKVDEENGVDSNS